MKRILYFIATGIMMACLPSCRHYPEKLEEVLHAAGANRPELEKVIDYYKQQGSDEKVKAAIFLIDNMKGNYSYEGGNVGKYEVILNKLDSLHQHHVKLPSTSPIVKAIWDSIVNVYGAPVVSNARKVYDCTHISADYLINHINRAFLLRDNTPWLKGISFENFCEFILPYRIGTERLEDWQRELDEKYKTFRDTCKGKSLYQAAFEFNNIMYGWMGLDGSLRAYPFDQSVSQMHKSRRGACKHLVFYETVAMRSLGMPVTVDYSPLWGDLNRGHHWNVLLLENGRHYAFDAADAKFGGLTKYPYRFAKVFRQTYASHEDGMPGASEVPAYLLNARRIDVTDEYVRVFDIDVPLLYEIPNKKSFSVICTYTGKQWKAQDYGAIKNNAAHFKKMGANLVYMAMYYDSSMLKPATDPFILDKEGHINFIKPSLQKTQQMVLLRKYPSIASNDSNMASMKGGCFQLANTKNFSDAITPARVNKESINIGELQLGGPGKYRYVRYLNPFKKKINVAEIEFYGSDNEGGPEKKLAGKAIGFPEVSPEIGYSYQNVFDHNLETFFSTTIMGVTDTSWAGLDLGEQKKIMRVRYLPRSDTNFILDGDIYELCYWYNDKWVSLGKTIASSQAVIYKNVPSGALYILHNRTRGKEERIFTWDNSRQAWW